ncbi:terminase small subunit [Poseidonocella sp. HB161398]|uniref:terminase small subunit n=1 Tax=Poseidonocella sp. HB161398 TaxID=2320855 RepID=UPI001109CE77|nr:terminase small subunit [Poseidonocella sp. HB161398]
MSEGQDLRPFTAEEAALVAAFPLPGGAIDGVVNKSQLAAAMGVSETTISQWLRKGLPTESDGTNGRAYAFRLALAWAWNRRREAEENASRARGDEVAAQLQLALLGGESADPSAGAKLTLAEQRKLLELELLRMQAARERGGLMRAEDVAAFMEDMGVAIRDALDALPDRLARECGLDARQVEAAVAACDEIQRGVAASMQEIAGDADGGDRTPV